MASKRYSKNRSSYILRKKHQYTDTGVIFERDWTTLGEREKLSPGKRQYLRNGNFIFTTNIINSYKRRRNGSEWIEGLTYDDVENASNIVNYVKVSYNGDRIDDYAYFGSAVELIKGTIKNVIERFPACIVVRSSYGRRLISYETGKAITLVDEYEVSNPFGIDLIHKAVDGFGIKTLSDDDNYLRFLTYSYGDYVVEYINRDISDIKHYKKTTKIIGYSIGEWLGDDDCPENDYIGIDPVITILATLANGEEITLKGYGAEGGIIFTSSVPNIVIRPKDEAYDDFYNKYDGFESKILSKNTTPLYTCTLKTPVEKYNGDIKFVNRSYTWPNDGYNLDVTSAEYGIYVNELINLGNAYDDYYSDNLYQKMTHEAIKNYDWSYTKYYDEDVETDNIEGGTRMEKLLRVYGRMFDDIKRHIDGVKMMSSITYDGVNNMPDAMLSDEAEVRGWDITSTIPVIDGVDTDTTCITDDFRNRYGINWYGTKNSEAIKFSDVDIDFMRRLILNTKRIMSTKGTVHSIDMVMGMFGFGGEDYTVIEKYMETNPIVVTEEFTQKVYDANYDKTLEHYITDEYGNLAYDPYDGIPIKNVYFGNVICAVPYFEPDKQYDGELYFQSLGGWGHHKGVKRSYGYEETYSYLHETSNITTLLGVNPYSVKEGDIYYVNDISDYVEYIENVPHNISHFFKLIDEYATDEIEGWKFIPMEESDKNTDDYKKCKYLESIVTTSDGNNPHVGYGNYDDGDDFVQTMAKPFKYAIDGYSFNTEDGYNKADSIEFSINELTSSHSKNGIVTDSKVKVCSRFGNKYYLNSKVVTFKNNINNSLYKKYFNSIILPYLKQVIPSTAILILENV